MKARDWTRRAVEEAGGDVERVDGAWNEVLQVQRALLLRNALPLATVDQSLVDSRLFVAIALDAFVRHLRDTRYDKMITKSILLLISQMSS